MRLLPQLLYAAVSISIGLTSVHASSRAREPLNYLTVLENAQINIPNKRVHAYSSFDLTFDLHHPPQHFRLALEPNYDILADDALVTVLGPDGEIKRTETINRKDHKVYLGRSFVVDENGHSTHVGTARISVLRDGIHPVFDGTFSVMQDYHHIQLRSTYMATKHLLDPHMEQLDDEYMAVWRDSDVGRPSHTELRRRMAEPACAADSLDFNRNLDHPVYRELLKRSEGRWGVASLDQLLGKRQSIDGGGAGNGNSAGVNLRTTIGDTSGCPKQRQVALLGVATDCSYMTDFPGNQTALKDNVIRVVNEASDLYQSTFNITLGLKNLTVIDRDCSDVTQNSATPWNLACTDPADMSQRLNLFSTWRSQQSDNNAYWSLFTKCNTGSEVGLSWLGQLCNHQGTSQQSNGTTSVVAGANVVARTGSEWQVFAHETGHTFGAVHDCTADTCQDTQAVSSSQCCPLSATACDANSQYLMNPFSSDTITQFSPCSVGNICSAIGRNSVQSGCLTDNKGVVTVTGAICGNGIVEADEDCDCGGSEGCSGNGCCNPTTCKYTSGSVCDWSNEGCCTQQCQHASNGTVCRASTGVCDPAETCPGDSGQCPPDSTTADGSQCGSGLQCASGQCTSRDQQCQTVMGQTTVGGNDTRSCGGSSCIIQCGSPELGAGCYEIRQNFLDGTICDGDGKCSNGVCQGSSVGGRARGWIDNNKTLFIVLVAVGGTLVLIGLVSCLVSCCRRRRRTKRKVKPPPRFQQPMVQPQTPYMPQASPYQAPPYQAPPYQAPPYQGFSRGYSGPAVRYA